MSLNLEIDNSAAEAERFLTNHNVDTVRIEWCDLYGVSRGKRMARSQFLACLESGTMFSTAALQMDLQGHAHALPGQATDKGWDSVIAYPDLSTLYLYAGEPNSARCLSHLHTLRGEPVGANPRQALHRVVQQARLMGWEASIGVELEFYLLPARASSSSSRSLPPDRPAMNGFQSGRLAAEALADSLPDGRQVYRMQSSEEEHRFLEPLYRQMAAANVEVEAFCAEDGPGQFEVVLQRKPAAEAADAAFIARNLIKELAARQGLTATFLSKPLPGCSGSGTHIHQSLWTPDGKPVFRGPEDPDIDLFWQYLAGQLHHFREASSFYLPTINAYKRIALREPEPIRIDWAYDDRSAALRVLGASNAKLRIENRAIAGEANPYLIIAAALATGLEGIREKLSLSPFFRHTHPDVAASTTTGEPLPQRLQQALHELDGSAVLRRWLGAELVDAFVFLKGVEVYRYETAITDWEIREYLTGL